MLAVLGCTSSEEPASSFVLRDSANVVVAENAADEVERIPVRHVPGEPALTIGTRHGSEPYQFTRVTGVTQLSDGTIVVVDVGAGEIRLYSEAGVFLRGFGRKGRGPGEFELMRLAASAGDSIIVYDSSLMRFTVLDTVGHVHRINTMQNRLSGFIGLIDSKAAVTAEPQLNRSNETTLVRMASLMQVVNLESGSADTLALLGDRQEVAVVVGERIQMVVVPYTVHPSVAVRGGRIAATDGIEPSVRVYAGDGALAMIIRIMAQPEALTRREFVQATETQAREAPSERRRAVEAAHRHMVPPATKPSLDQLVISNDGHIWARHFNVDQAQPALWTVFEPSGRAVARISTRPGFRLDEVGADYLLGTWIDADGVPFIHRYDFSPDDPALSAARPPGS
jgi:hypothetical protein